jgi:hypothetical protein
LPRSESIAITLIAGFLIISTAGLITPTQAHKHRFHQHNVIPPTQQHTNTVSTKRQSTNSAVHEHRLHQHSSTDSTHDFINMSKPNKHAILQPFDVNHVLLSVLTPLDMLAMSNQACNSKQSSE